MVGMAWAIPTEEAFPELRADGSSEGSLFYLHNAFGLMRSRSDGGHILTIEYYGAGRRTGAEEGDDDWQKFLYGTLTSASNLSKGKLEKAIRHGFASGPGPLTS